MLLWVGTKISLPLTKVHGDPYGLQSSYFFFLFSPLLSVSSSSSDSNVSSSTTSPHSLFLRATCCHFTDLPPDGAKGPTAESRLASKGLEALGLASQGFGAGLGSWALPSRHGGDDPNPGPSLLTP